MNTMVDPKRKWSSRKGEGECITFLKNNLGYQGEDCLTWPFSVGPNGYGMLGYMGKSLYAHRMMCELIHGPAPSPEHDAAHSCGRGRFGCVDPRHLSWKTIRGNALDSRRHGTHSRNAWGKNGKLTRGQISEIWAAKGRETQAETAIRFGISQPTVRDIYLGRTHLGMTAITMLRQLGERDLGDFKNFSSGLWSRSNLEAMIDDLVVDTNNDQAEATNGQSGPTNAEE